MRKLGVNIDHIATLRQARKEGIPDILDAAHAVYSGGADSITVHLREDRRHIQDEDVFLLKDKGPLPINFEMSASEEIVNIAIKLLPRSACIVPEKREELTTEGGLDVASDTQKIKSVIERLKAVGIEVSLFIDPNEKQVKASAFVGADAVELHTGKFANEFPSSPEWIRIKEAAAYAAQAGLKVNAGHGLDYSNVSEICSIAEISELNIGYSIVCNAVFVGLEKAVRDMKKLLC